MSNNKYGAKKVNNSDSLMEEGFFNEFKTMQAAKKITGLKQLDKKDDFYVLIDQIILSKNEHNGRKVSRVKYTPDFEFTMLEDAKLGTEIKKNKLVGIYLREGEKVIVETKGSGPKQARDYPVKRALFISKILKPGQCFVEITVKGQVRDIIIYRKRK